MNEYIYNIGTSGQVKIQDYSDTNRYVIPWIKGPSIDIPSVPWSWVVYDSGGNAILTSNLLSYHLLANNNWQRLGIIYVQQNATFLLGIGGTGTDAMGQNGETFTIPLMGNPDISLCSVKVGDSYKKAIPYINDGGIWKPVQILVMQNSEWKKAT